MKKRKRATAVARVQQGWVGGGQNKGERGVHGWASYRNTQEEVWDAAAPALPAAGYTLSSARSWPAGAAASEGWAWGSGRQPPSSHQRGKAGILIR